MNDVRSLAIDQNLYHLQLLVKEIERCGIENIQRRGTRIVSTARNQASIEMGGSE